ncbi:MAG: YopX family protein [Candidatus Thermoplasmatota archaeon]|nr:YopX family protein [Candidatus Thermoplasmatota archaeon]
MNEITRVLKFRAWDIHNKEMMKTLYGWKGGFEEFTDAAKNAQRYYEVMQYIGKTDKHNTEIYDGDILRDEYDRILLVVWHNCGFSLKAITETNFIRATNIMDWFEGDTPRPEIIGNKFENPELLQT